MSDKIKPYLTWGTYILLLLSVWTIRYQMTTIVFALALGIIGTLLIFFTEVGYTYRKARLIEMGSVRTWLRTHIFMGIAGPLMILWHADLSFYGFAGWLTWLTAIVVISGFVGRYIYRLVPRSLKGQELSLIELDAQAAALSATLDELLSKSPEAAALVQSINRQFGATGSVGPPASANAPGLWQLMKSSVVWELNRVKLRRAFAGRHDFERGLLEQIRDLELAQLALERRIGLLDASKATLSKWTVFHKPLTLILFVGILLHVVNVFYYGKVLP